MTVIQETPALPAVPPLIAETAATLRACSGCASLPSACLSGLTGMHHAPCCPECDHYPELPLRSVNEPHKPSECSNWAKSRGIPLNVACELHWLPQEVRDYRARILADYYAAQDRRSTVRVYTEAELVPAERLYRETHANGRAE